MDVGVHEAKTQLSRLLQRVQSGEEIVIRRRGVAVAKLVSAVDLAPREFGTDCGVFTVPEDFDMPLPDDVLETFEA